MEIVNRKEKFEKLWLDIAAFTVTIQHISEAFFDKREVILKERKRNEAASKIQFIYRKKCKRTKLSGN